MSKSFTALAAAGLIMVAGQASAAGATASLDTIRGQVMVNQGAGYAQAAASPLKAGDRVVAMGESSARVTYADGCVISVAPKAMATIGTQSPCAASALVRSSQPAVFWEDLNLVWVLVGIGLIAVIIAAVDDDDEDPVSP